MSINYDGKDVRLLIKSSSNEEDPLGIYRIVKFNTLKKQRRIQWFEFEPAVLASEEAQKNVFFKLYRTQIRRTSFPHRKLKKENMGYFS